MLIWAYGLVSDCKYNFIQQLMTSTLAMIDYFCGDEHTRVANALETTDFYIFLSDRFHSAVLLSVFFHAAGFFQIKT
jgi:hypothetical protein